jgi:DNA-binding XRE family transcriptional regulator
VIAMLKKRDIDGINRMIDTARTRAGLSSAELVSLIGVEKSTYYNRRKDGDWRLRTLRQIDSVVHFTPEEKAVIL